MPLTDSISYTEDTELYKPLLSGGITYVFDLHPLSWRIDIVFSKLILS